MSEYNLHCFANSGNSYKVALFLAFSQQNWTPVFVDYFEGATRSDQFRRDLNAQGECPVLEHDGHLLGQSGAILQYLSDKTGKYAAESETQKYEILKWLLFDNHKLTASIASYRAGTFVVPDAFKPDVLAFLQGRMMGALDILEQHLAGQRFVASQTGLTIADFSIAGYLLYPEEELGLQMKANFPAIDRWLSVFREHPEWRSPYDLMPGAPALTS